MCRTFEHITIAQLSFSGRPHTPVNVADKMLVVGLFLDQKRRWKSQKNFKDFWKLGVRNIAQYSEANVPAAFFLLTFTSSTLYLPCLQEHVAHHRS